MLLNNKIPLTYIFGKIKFEIIYTTIIWLITFFLTHGYASINPQIPVTVPAFIGTAISIILSFKLSQSYDRWWEARKIWGSIVNESRTFVLKLQSFVKPANNNDIRTLAFRHIAWCFSLAQSLRGLNPVENLDKYLSAEDIKLISKHNNKPLAILQLNTKHITDLKAKEAMDIFSQIQINHTLVSFSNVMGMAERIKSTVFPVTYRLFLHWMIYLFTVVLSIALYDLAWYFEFPLLLALSSSFFLLEKAATELQDPFSNRPTDTAMTTIATNIEINIKQLLNETEIPQPLPPNKFYSL
jgi:ion channel-forming bestrophin family protein